MFGLHVLLAVGLAAFAGALSPLGVLVAFVLIHLVLRTGAGILGLTEYVGRLERGLAFLGWFALAVLRASLHVAGLVLRREVVVNPAVVSVPLASRDERAVTLVACLITLTPGTLALDYDPGEGILFVHALDPASAEEVVREVGELERRLLGWMEAGRDKGGGMR